MSAARVAATRRCPSRSIGSSTQHARPCLRRALPTWRAAPAPRRRCARTGLRSSAGGSSRGCSATFRSGRALRKSWEPRCRAPSFSARSDRWASLRQGGRGHPRRGDPDPAHPPQARRDHLLTLVQGICQPFRSDAAPSSRNQTVRVWPCTPTAGMFVHVGGVVTGGQCLGDRLGLAGPGDHEPDLVGPVERAEREADPLRRRLGESVTATAIVSSTSSCSEPGNSDATCPSGPRPSISTSNSPVPRSRTWSPYAVAASCTVSWGPSEAGISCTPAGAQRRGARASRPTPGLAVAVLVGGPGKT